MGKVLNIIPVSDLRQDAAKVLKQVRDSKEPLVITQRGRAAAVMLSVEAYERSERDRELLRLLAKGEREIEAGEGHDLDSVFAEADALLAEDPSWRSVLPLLPGLSFSLHLHTFARITFKRQFTSVNKLKTYCKGSKNSRNQEESCRNFLN